MTDAKPQGRRPRDRPIPRTFTPLALESRTHITTAEAAHHLNLSPQTLRTHACFGTGLIRPHRIPGYSGLLWPVDEIKAALSSRRVLSEGFARHDEKNKAQAAEAAVQRREWKRLAISAILALEKWESAAKNKSNLEMDSARKSRDVVLAEWRKSGGRV